MVLSSIIEAHGHATDTAFGYCKFTRGSLTGIIRQTGQPDGNNNTVQLQEPYPERTFPFDMKTFSQNFAAFPGKDTITLLSISSTYTARGIRKID